MSSKDQHPTLLLRILIPSILLTLSCSEADRTNTRGIDRDSISSEQLADETRLQTQESNSSEKRSDQDGADDGENLALGLAYVPSQLSGTLIIHHVDDFQMKGENRYYLEVDADPEASEREKERIPLKIASKPKKKLSTGSRVKVSGKMNDVDFIVASIESGGPEMSETEMLESPTAAIVGAQQTIVVLANFSNKSLSCSKSAITNKMFGPSNSVNQIYLETSKNALSFAGDVVGPFTLSQGAGNCDFEAWGVEAQMAAAAQGINFSNYARHVFVFPEPTAGCGFSGVGTVGGMPSKSWIVSCDWLTAYAHELGHNLTMDHATTNNSEYGDNSCFMGGPSLPPRLNAPHLKQMGWLPSAQITSLVDSGGAFTLDPLGSTAGGTQLIQIPYAGGLYYVSYRTPTGFDANLTTQYANRISIHSWAGGGAATSHKSSLSAGGSWSDPSIGLTVKHVSRDALKSNVQIDFGCTPAEPVLTVQPPERFIAAGASAGFTIKVQNNDGLGCPARNIGLMQSTSNLWTAQLSSLSFSVQAGASYSATLTMSPPPSSIDGAQGQASIQVSSDGQGIASLTALATVDTIPPGAPQSLTKSATKKRINLAWNAATDNRLVAAYEVFRNGKLIGSVSSLSFADSTARRGTTYTYSVKAVDGAGLRSPSSNSVKAARK